MSSVSIITPTTGSKDLKRCIESVQNQTFVNLKHIVVVDGKQYLENSLSAFPENMQKEVQLLPIQENVGKAMNQNFYGHRIYAAVGFLCNTDYICYLDQDNWLEPNHVESLVNTIEQEGLDWSYSLRNIHDYLGNFLMQDNCESLGKWSTWVDPNSFHIDTSCYCVKREIAIRAGGVWYGGWGQDRVWFNVLRQHFPNFNTTGKHTLNYALGGNPDSVKEEFFIEGNKKMQEQYGDKFPWMEEKFIVPMIEVS